MSYQIQGVTDVAPSGKDWSKVLLPVRQPLNRILGQRGRSRRRNGGSKPGPELAASMENIKSLPRSLS
jgi:hypothetical protein